MLEAANWQLSRPGFPRYADQGAPLNSDIAGLKQWLNGELAQALPAHDVAERYRVMHPRCVLLKTLPAVARVELKRPA